MPPPHSAAPTGLDPGIARLIEALAREAAGRDHRDALLNRKTQDRRNDQGGDLRAVFDRSAERPKR